MAATGKAKRSAGTLLSLQLYDSTMGTHSLLGTFFMRVLRTMYKQWRRSVEGSEDQVEPGGGYSAVVTLSTSGPL